MWEPPPQNPRMLPPPTLHGLTPRPSTGYMDTEPGDSEPTRVDPLVPGSSLPGGQPTSPASRVLCGDLGLMRHEHPVENKGFPPRQEEMSASEKGKPRWKELTLPSMFSTLSNTLSVSATDIQLA